mmetsp:Transcript_11659/g.20804  ORF Transcript_11659/g.20804 Transcript_11659/m.20804 type:complete len:1079 (+) Transcript_11659:197-3433(+)|eukprot:CAMPEP_0206369780 /NCGR_PEP_ID=MMETSP0294-20121207/5508_1 /ASSEMBLY_ACC=CAM_ASM_000327 /TAXON_ID=39354 /ORGANISM="Heterosigma akashiwo, Strain CCMP2393" /LENGTH=1078 /DNA_ID=CAMNT_0053816615 /DNA_START=178 /DNA_END=3414 /DNA_ORIENTATION=+
MSIGIKVAIRCRPFTIDDDLGVHLVQNGEEEGEVNLLKSTYTNNRFAFSWSWWSAYGWERHAKEPIPPEASAMTLINQNDVYESCGKKIKADLYDGNAVVMFAYGLSGSGKTFTVFGPDAVDIPEAWFKHSEPHPLWGIFPHLAYEIFQDKEDGWKVTMKYFQNVVDIVRDLMSPAATEQHYKSGMKKDQDGFMDIEWCRSTVLRSWDDLRSTFQTANARKAIAPTQFNHQSTRGHCIMTLEVEKPKADDPSSKDRGRLYVCDLAGTEPAGDIYYANYEKKVFEDGSIEHVLKGPHQDQRRTKELQDQGKKINLSLSEMAQFFMKMAEAIKKKKLKPGASLPGCNSYFLCKYLKDTMLQARTYLFCAIRPEVTYHKYTYATLGFAKNASVIKLQPKKAMGNVSAAERKLMAELEQMKLLVEQLTKEKDQLASAGGGGGGGGGGEDNDQVSALQAMLAAKQAELENVLEYGDDAAEGGAGAQDAEAAYMAQQRDEYANRGVSLTYFDKDTTEPHFINLDEDPFRSKRFMYILESDRTAFGPGGDIKPMALAVVKDHCVVERRGEEKDQVVIINGKGETLVNGAKLAEGEERALQPYDRVAMGGELLLFRHAGKNPEGVEEPTADAAVDEYQKALNEKDAEQQRLFDERMRQFEEEKAKWEAERQQAIAEGTAVPETRGSMPQMPDEFALSKEEEEKQAMEALDKEILDLMPKIKEAKEICRLFNRGYMELQMSLQKPKAGSLGVPRPKVQVTNGRSGEAIYLDPVDFVKNYSILKDELTHLRHNIESEQEYTPTEHHDPLFLLFDALTEVGSGTVFPEYLIFLMDTEKEDRAVEIKNISQPYNNIGFLEVAWEPLPRHPDMAGPEELPEVLEEDDLLGKSWTYRIKIKGASGLPVITDMAYVQYEFFGEEFVTETVEQNTHNPVFDYEFVHHVDVVTKEFIEFLKRPMEFHVFMSPLVQPPKDKVSTLNPVIVARMTGMPDPEGADASSSAAASIKKQLSMGQELAALQARNGELEEQVRQLQAALAEANRELAQYRDLTTPRTKTRIQEAQAKDAALNGGEPEVKDLALNGGEPYIEL